jgi:pimeloyl-ACP methyl ester carboxylesterase
MPVRTPEKLEVAGLAVTVWPGDGPTVLGLPGLGSSGHAWAPLAASLPDAHLVAPDLRGRGRSKGLTGEPGLAGHARDVAAVARELELRDLVVVGHSMGAYLAPLVARELGDRVARLVLVDGGIRPAFPFFMGPRMTRLSFGRQLRGADREYPHVEAFAKKGRVGPMLASRPDLLPTVMEMLAAELDGPPGRLRPQLDVDRAVADAVDCLHGPEVVAALEELAVPTQVFLAENMKKDGQRPFISDKAVAPWLAKKPNLTVTRLPGNHVTVLFAPEVVAAVGS